MIYLEGSGLSESEKVKFKDFLAEFGEMISETPGLTVVAWHETDARSSAPVTSKPYTFAKVKLMDDIIMFIDSLFDSTMVLCRKNNGVQMIWRRVDSR